MTVIPRTAARTDRERMTRAAWLIGLGLLLLLAALDRLDGLLAKHRVAGRDGAVHRAAAQQEVAAARAAARARSLSRSR